MKAIFYSRSSEEQASLFGVLHTRISVHAVFLLGQIFYSYLDK